jgi:hypothetical protein
LNNFFKNKKIKINKFIFNFEKINKNSQSIYVIGHPMLNKLTKNYQFLKKLEMVLIHYLDNYQIRLICLEATYINYVKYIYFLIFK